MSEKTVPATIMGLPFKRVLGTSPRVGWGSAFYPYAVYVEEGTTAHPRRFAKTIDAILADDRSWIKGGKVSFERVSSNIGTYVILAKPATVDKLCYPLQTEGQVSCCQGNRVTINVERWKHAVPHWTGSIETYRQMVCNHEWGHRIGQPHRWCQGTGQPAPVMQQQTYGMQGCKCNSWPLASEL